jgi:hypothetical protein
MINILKEKHMTTPKKTAAAAAAEIKEGAPLNTKVNGQTALEFAAARDRAVDLDVTSAKGETALQASAKIQPKAPRR